MKDRNGKVIKKGDRVKVVYRNPTWTGWVYQMDYYVGGTFVINEEGPAGVPKLDNYFFPTECVEKIEEKEKVMNKEDYLKAHKASGIEVGDKVKMLRNPVTNEQGWDNYWGPVDYHGYVGKYYKVVSDRKEKGFGVERSDSRSFSLPWFVIEVIEKGNKVKTDDLDFGCLEKNTIDRLINAIMNREPMCFDDFSVDYSVVVIARKMRDLINEIHSNGHQDYGDEIFELAKRITKARSK